MKNPKVSIIVPFYNTEPWLGRCLDSLARQTLSDIEILLIDDGSTDSSGKIADEYAAHDKRIKVIHQKKAGTAVARNAGLKIARGEYIGFVDSDDWVDLNFYELLYNTAKKYGSDIAKGNFYFTDNNGKTYQAGPLSKDILKNRAYFSWGFWSAIYRRGMLMKNRIDFPNEIITGQDVVFLLKAVVCANRIDICMDTAYHYERRDGSADSQILSDKKIQSKSAAISLKLDFLNNRDCLPEIYSVSFALWLDWWLKEVFHRAETDKGRRLVVRCALNFYKKCKYPQDYALLSRNPEYVRLLAYGDETALYNYLCIQKKKSRGLARLWKHLRFWK